MNLALRAGWHKNSNKQWNNGLEESQMIQVDYLDENFDINISDRVLIKMEIRFGLMKELSLGRENQSKIFQHIRIDFQDPKWSIHSHLN